MSSLELTKTLKDKWAALYESKEGEKVFRSNFDSLTMRELDGKYLAYFNPSRNLNKPEYQGKFDENDEESKDDEEEESVYKDFDENKFNFNSCAPEEVLFYVDLDEEEVITKERETAFDEKQLEGNEDNEIPISEMEHHPIMINAAPICPNHSILAVYPQEMLPQTVGEDIILIMLQIFTMSGSEDLRVGYNSIGGAATVNHLHFQLFFASDLFPTGKLPIEETASSVLVKTSLKNKDESINMFSVGVEISELDKYPVRGFVIRTLDEKADSGEAFKSIAFIVGTICNMLLEQNIPHNLVFSNLGRTVYLIPREFESKQDTTKMKCGFFEISGLAVCKDQEFYEKLTTKEFEAFLAQCVSLDNKRFKKLKDEVVGIIEKTFK